MIEKYDKWKGGLDDIKRERNLNDPEGRISRIDENITVMPKATVKKERITTHRLAQRKKKKREEFDDEISDEEIDWIPSERGSERGTRKSYKEESSDGEFEEDDDFID